ncbi:accessory gene regulator ArgB-like protein [Clostridium frigidicarnis]|uniref:Accessory gene regulator B n=1 Tax=Clostridium frigidicarnis TaxID=84698 RepID=A0A1I0Y6E6_9CLOT|nr:accessory gene regulator B family protein [Clostridium frigidicarnis]SFB08879.1 accessory gene regulator B [Clostridium frigidicarnis]
MFSIESITKKMSNVISEELNLDNNKKQVLNYGGFAIVHIFISITLTIILGLIFNVVVEALILSFSISILRKFSGGVHASTPNNCLILGNFVCIFCAIIVKFVIIGNVAEPNLIYLDLLGFLWCYYILYNLSPIDNPNKPLRNKKKKLALKKKSIITVVVYQSIVLIMVLYSPNELVGYSTALLLGALWQCFTLTNPCFKVITTLDSFLNKLF